ncbi:unnamed protein product [Protopolystoma xenopodis]|uniref:Uncharacterized protein n=1 Tax=Protopolystoma xenopodis TaxID=117903 RepID=A0A3S5C4K0_9PLAT|nr:unnamed protein product [Protopolystoma xenopodis]
MKKVSPSPGEHYLEDFVIGDERGQSSKRPLSGASNSYQKRIASGSSEDTRHSNQVDDGVTEEDKADVHTTNRFHHGISEALQTYA